MAGMKEFTTSAKAAIEPDSIDQPITFKVDDVEVRAYEPSPGQMAMMYSALSDLSTDNQRVAGIVDFFLGLLDGDSRRVLAQRLMDREDPFELDELTEIMTWLIGEWSARPTRPSSASTPSPRRTGRKSTVAALNGGLTPGSSDSTASAT
jgi:hypothetical protein